MSIPEEIIAMERAALDRSDRGDARGFLEISDPEVVYIDPTLDKPIHGLAELTEYYSQFTGDGEDRRGEMLNAKVTVAGEAAVLTFNYRISGGPAYGWNSTEVYRHTGDGWRITHTHWSYVRPEKP